MGLIAVDLGSTNLKVAVYDDALACIGWSSAPVEYLREGGRVEFDAQRYSDKLLEMIAVHVSEGRLGAGELCHIALTGQAESLVVLGRDGRPLMNAISWMDERSGAECAELSARLDSGECYRVTGQMGVLPTWPATKILWLRRNRPDIFEQTAHYALLKDYIVYRLTGKLMADMSIATFSLYFDIHHKCYWQKMLDLCGIRAEQLPPLAEPCTVAGPMTVEAAAAARLSAKTVVNIGTLDHFAGMIGAGNIHQGAISLSTGTVMALAAMAKLPLSDSADIAIHYGFRPGAYIMLPVAESGGVSLEWFRRTCMREMSFAEIDEAIQKRSTPNGVLFLPYLVGTNAPEFDREACGAFAGLRVEHDAVDMAYAVMEGVAHLLRKNIEAIEGSGTKALRIIATGGGAKSAVWCQLQADVTGIPVEIPREKEAACLGAAMLAALDAGLFGSLEAACKAVVAMESCYYPRKSAALERKYRQFCRFYHAMLDVAHTD